MTTFDALTLARGWLATAVASGNDDDRPALHKTICVDLYPEGVRLVATDSYILLTSWVPNVEHPDAPEPDRDDAPIATAIAIDPHGRARGFFAHLLKLAAQADKDGDVPIEARLQLGVTDSDPETNTGTLDGMEATYLIAEHPDHERLKLHTYEGTFPAWQHVLAGFTRVETGGIALNPDLVVRLAKAAKVHSSLLVWRFGGEASMALVEIADSYPATHGAVMPVRWDFDRNAPLVKPDDGQDEEEQA